MALSNFEGAVAVVTGGASGIGLATARALYARNAHIVLADINTQGLQQAGEIVHQQNPESANRVLAVTTDVTNEIQVQELMRQAADICGRIDLVVTCAGIGKGGPIDSFTSSEMRTMMNVNFMGTYNCTQAALSTMRKQQSGHFVFISSAAGKLGYPMLSGYCASKWAVRGFSHALRTELYGSGIGVTTVYPAWVDTPMFSRDSMTMQLMNIEMLLTADQVANEILQAVTEDRRDLSIIPDSDIAYIIQLFKDDPDKAEDLTGKSFQKQLARLSGQQAQ